MKSLSPAAPRNLLHTRQVQCTGWERDDGLWDVEGRMSDVRTIDLDDSRGNAARKAGDPVHLMSLRITLDERFTIVAAEAVSHQTPYEDCAQINAAYEKLVGLRIEAGFTQAVKTRFRGVQGCTHLTELLGPMATTAFQAIRPALERRREAAGLPAFDDGARPALLDSCHAFRRGSRPAIVRWGRVAEALPPAPETTAN
ncbi:MAG: uncharacterized protein JWQ73_2168 [Variovorax sp.]|jgi:hypothetical protein|nr:uncharacterized protein [Variovorax sp.]